MPVVLSSSSIVPSCHVNHLKVNALSNPNYTFLPCNTPWKLCFTNRTVTVLHKKKFPRTLKFIPAKCMNSSTDFFGEENGVANDWIDQEEPGDMDSPWEGAVLYQRDPSITHVEYCTTLERLGFGKFSTDVSKSRASLMGIRVTKAVKDFPHGTPVLISIDVTRKKRKLRLDGIIRTVLTLGCIRCGKPAAECVYSNFSLLLTEDPVEEPEIIDMGVIYREDKFRSASSEEGEDDDDSIDFDDRLHFPPQEKLIDISKNIRDTVHVEIVMTAVCDPTCKGFCINCGTDLNTGSCVCSKQKVKEKGYGPFGGLREKMRQN